MSKGMVFTNIHNPQHLWTTSGGIVWYHEDGYKLRRTSVTHKDLHDERLGFRFKELRHD